MYRIDVDCSFESVWRYNMVLMCGGYDATDEQLYVVSREDIIAEQGNEGEEVPPAVLLPRRITLDAQDAQRIRVILYIVPHTLPQQKDISQTPPFELTITVENRGDVVYHRVHHVDQWSGDSIEINLRGDNRTPPK
ncbi:MAG: hypothetical protein SNH13_01380 [Rikenellaceae bacterium]